MGPRPIWNEATRIYSTCRSVESAGYCDLSLSVLRTASTGLVARRVDDGVERVPELLIDPPRLGCGGVVVGAPFRIDGLEGVREAGKEDRDV